jgi:deoxyadenosine/deoxycytidine kinase
MPTLKTPSRHLRREQDELKRTHSTPVTNGALPAIPGGRWSPDYDSLVSNLFLALAGNVGAGKSALCGELARRFDARAEIEEVGRNPHFENFYADPKRWAFSSQLAFAAEATARHVRAQDGGPCVMDRTLYEGVAVFARLLASRGDISATQFELLTRLSDTARALPVQPQVLIYLTAPAPVLARRIKARGRRGEEAIDVPYLTSLDLLYGDFIAGWDVCPVLSVDTAARDLRRPDEVDCVVGRIRDLLP